MQKLLINTKKLMNSKEQTRDFVRTLLSSKHLALLTVTQAPPSIAVIIVGSKIVGAKLWSRFSGGFSPLVWVREETNIGRGVALAGEDCVEIHVALSSLAIR